MCRKKVGLTGEPIVLQIHHLPALKNIQLLTQVNNRTWH